MKSEGILCPGGAKSSLPVRGAWIEIGINVDFNGNRLSLPVRGAWIEMSWLTLSIRSGRSLPVRGAWIEISAQGNIWTLAFVAPRKGSVD